MRSGNSPSIRPLASTSLQAFAVLVGTLALLISSGCGGGGGSTGNNGSNGGSVPASVSGTIAVGNTPRAIAVDPTTNKIYVADFGSEGNDGICQTCYCPGVNGGLTVIDGATQSPTTTGFSYAYQNPLDLAVDPANHNLYVASRVFPQPNNPTCGYGDMLEVIDSPTLSQTATTYVGRAVETAHIAVNQNTGNV